MIVNYYLLFRSLMAVGENEFFSQVGLDFTVLYLRPEGRSENSPCWGLVGLWRWRLLSCGLCGGKCSAQRAVESW